MFTQQQLDQWEADGVPIPDFWREVAVAAPPKSITLKFVSIDETEYLYVLTFFVRAKSLAVGEALVSVADADNPFRAVEETITLNPNGSISFKVNFPKVEGNLIPYWISKDENPSTLRATISCDGLSQTIQGISVAKTSKKTQAEQELVCYCKKVEFSQEDWERLITAIRKRDNLQQVPDMNEKKGTVRWKDTITGEVLDANENGKRPNEDAVKHYVWQSRYDEKYKGQLIKDRLFYVFLNPDQGKVDYNIKASERNYSYFSKQMNHMFNKFGIKTCSQRVHFLAQVYVETQHLSKTYEYPLATNPNGGDFYRGRGLLHLTHDYNYLRYYEFRKNASTDYPYYKAYINKRKKISYIGVDGKTKERYQDIAEFNVDTQNTYIPSEVMEECNKLVDLISKELFYACDAAGWYWQVNKINDYATFDEKSIINVSAALNNPSAVNTDNPEGRINGYLERKEFYNSYKAIFEDGCK